MRVLQFGFDGDADNPHLPHNYTRDVVAYTGTHDNDTTQGWSQSLTGETAQRVQSYLGAQSDTINQNMERAVLASVAQLAILPAQDLLRLGSQARLNTPGTATGNWQWRLPPGSLSASLAQRYALLNGLFGRFKS
jgi:4-alpha-glucanotransferase